MKTLKFTKSDRLKVDSHIDVFFNSMESGKQYEIEIRLVKQKRSLDANNLLWVMIDQLAEKLGIPKIELYRNAIKEIGGVSEVYCGKQEAIERLCSEWEKRGLGWFSETHASKLPGCVNATLYYGSSSYDVSQMSRLIDNVIQDCHAVGIETMSEEERNKALDRWGK